MDQVTIEQKLQLLEQLHSRYEQNQFDIKKREDILLGNISSYKEKDSAIQISNSTFKIRSAIALMLLVIIILLDIEGAKIFGIDSLQVFSTLKTDYFDLLVEK